METGLIGANPAGKSANLGIWRDERVLVIAEGVRLPDVCVKCGSVARGPRIAHTVRRQRYLGDRIGESRVVEMPLCAKHTSRRRLLLRIAGGLVASGVTAFFVWTRLANPALLVSIPLTAVALVVAGVTALGLALRLPEARRIAGPFVWLRVHQGILSGLPAWPGIDPALSELKAGGLP
jgi:hypothetical protein